MYSQTILLFFLQTVKFYFTNIITKCSFQNKIPVINQNTTSIVKVALHVIRNLFVRGQIYNSLFETIRGISNDEHQTSRV